ncbi:MAG: hypothetical protein A4E57_03855 [Syntrophorhabdaceae bacterium PtaU1.Bin034]|nr:MAG: hypothetical protein A4E57_03855 [Syntrophorhabdaceae bacterium PtaU1.Bin034]
MLDHILYRHLTQGRVEPYSRRAHRQIPLRRVNTKGHVAPPHPRAGTEFHGGFLSFQGDHVHLVVKYREINRVHLFHRPGLFLRDRLRPQPLHYLEIPSKQHIVHEPLLAASEALPSICLRMPCLYLSIVSFQPGLMTHVVSLASIIAGPTTTLPGRSPS